MPDLRAATEPVRNPGSKEDRACGHSPGRWQVPAHIRTGTRRFNRFQRGQKVRQLVDEGAQLVEVLPRDEYEEQHLPGAIGIPLKELDADAVAVLKRENAGDRLLLGLDMRPQPTSRVPARDARFPPGLRLHSG